MPLPERGKDESQNEFINRCMADKIMIKEYPKIKQRVAVCQSQAKKRK